MSEDVWIGLYFFVGLIVVGVACGMEKSDPEHKMDLLTFVVGVFLWPVVFGGIIGFMYKNWSKRK